jgi:hypothetical protein
MLYSLILSIAACWISDAAAVSINIDPPRAEITVKPGEEKSGFIVVQNKDEVGSTHVKAYAEDVVYLPDGSNDFLPLNSTPWSLGDSIKIGPTEFDIPAGKQVMVRYVVSLPKDAKGGRYGVIFFEAGVPPAEVVKIGANINLRIGTMLLVTAQNTAIFKAKIKELGVTPAEEKGKPLTIACVIYNEGNVIARPSGSVKIIDAAKALVAEVPMNKEKGGVMPDTARTYYAECKELLKKGVYHAQVVLDYGGSSLLGGQTKFEIK